MLKFILGPLAAISLVVSVGAHADEASEIAAVKSAMNELNQAFVQEDWAAIRALATPDHIAAGPVYDGSVSLDEQIAMFPRISLSEYVPTEPTVTLLADSVAMSNFEISIAGTFDGAPLHKRAFVSEIWVKRDGKWLQRAYLENAIADR